MHLVSGSRDDSRMRWVVSALTVLLALTGTLILAGPAEAQTGSNLRSWVSGVGSDNNPCSRTAPCQTFGYALASTAPGGEIDCLDPGDFGSLYINHAISIICNPASNGGVLWTLGDAAVAVQAGPTDRVVLQGLDLEGAGQGAGGVAVISGLDVYIIRCTIRDFSNYGVQVGVPVPDTTTVTPTCVFIMDSFIENDNIGVNVQGVYNVKGVNTTYVAAISNTAIDGNTGASVQVSSGLIGLVRSILSNDGPGMSIRAGGSIVSYRPGNIISGSTLPTSTVDYK